MRDIAAATTVFENSYFVGDTCGARGNIDTLDGDKELWGACGVGVGSRGKGHLMKGPWAIVILIMLHIKSFVDGRKCAWMKRESLYKRDTKGMYAYD